MTDATRAIQAAVARADLILSTALFGLRLLAPELIVGGVLWLLIRREEKR